MRQLINLSPNTKVSVELPEFPRVIIRAPLTSSLTITQAGLWTGEGPPTTENTAGAKVGDEYLDELTGDLYRLTPGE